jgi:hypothetical protein
MIISNRRALEADEALCVNLMKKDPHLIQYIGNKTRQMIEMAVSVDGRVIKYLNTRLLDNDIYLKAVTSKGSSLRYIKEPCQTEEICKIAVYNNPNNIKYACVQTEEIALYAVKNSTDSLIYIYQQNDEICLQAIKMNPKQISAVINQTEKICMIAVKHHKTALLDIKDPSYKVCLEAVLNGASIYTIKDDLMREKIRNCVGGMQPHCAIF